MKINECRLCLQINCEKINVKNDKNYLNIVSQFFPWFQIDEKHLNNLICLNCWLHIDQFNLFYKKIEQIQKKLKNENVKNSTIDTVRPYIKSELEKSIQSNIINDNDIKLELDHTNVSINYTQKNGEDYNFDSDLEKNIESKEKPRKLNESDTLLNTNEKKNIKLKIFKKKKTENIEWDNKIRDFFKLQCNLCLENFFMFEQMLKHYRDIHSIQRGYVNCCKKKLFRKCELIEHMTWHLNPNAYCCTICNKQFMAPYTLKLHMHMHANENDRIYKCTDCGKGFAMKYLLKQHLRLTHIADERKIFKCEECGLRFGMPSMLQSHIRGVHKFANAHMCDICAKIFKSKIQCERHRIEHEDKPKLQCDLCKTWLKNRHTLLDHMNRRHRSTPIACSQCGKMAPNKDALRSHIQYSHTDNNRLHQCKICNRSFKKSIGLKEHMAQHTGGYLYTCPYCPNMFNSNANMHTHRKKVHPDEWTRDRKRASK